MKYSLLNLSVLVIVVSLTLAITKQKLNRSMLYTLAVVLVMTAIFDSLMIKAGLFRYDAESILGIYIWLAPIEDFAYAVASVLLIGLLWEYYEEKE